MRNKTQDKTLWVRKHWTSWSNPVFHCYNFFSFWSFQNNLRMFAIHNSIRDFVTDLLIGDTCPHCRCSFLIKTCGCNRIFRLSRTVQRDRFIRKNASGINLTCRRHRIDKLVLVDWSSYHHFHNVSSPFIHSTHTIRCSMMRLMKVQLVSPLLHWHTTFIWTKCFHYRGGKNSPEWYRSGTKKDSKVSETNFLKVVWTDAKQYHTYHDMYVRASYHARYVFWPVCCRLSSGTKKQSQSVSGGDKAEAQAHLNFLPFRYDIIGIIWEVARWCPNTTRCSRTSEKASRSHGTIWYHLGREQDRTMSMYRTDVPREIIIILRVSYHVCESTNECIISALLLICISYTAFQRQRSCQVCLHDINATCTCSMNVS